MDRPPQKSGLFDPFSRDVLEFSAVVELVGGFLSGPIGRLRLGRLEPHTRLEEIRRDLERAAEAREYLRSSPRPGLGSLHDPRPALERARIEGSVLTPFEILDLLAVARAAQGFRSFFDKSLFPRLVELVSRLADFREVTGALEGKILPDGSLDSSASPKLARIRKDIERARRELQSALEKLVRRLAQDGLLQDEVVTIRNERMVLPVRAEEKRQVGGVVHGASSSGATVFVEPLETVPLNNELVVLRDRELAEVQRILAEFTARLRERREDLAQAVEVLSELELTMAKAEFARAYDCCLPEFVAERGLRLKGVRHPLLEKALSVQGRRPVPITIELKAPKTLVVVSGPNTGGKTVALKTIGMVALMAQSGLPVPAEEARVPLYGRVLADIGDQQSIQANLSTFSAHIVNIQGMVEAARCDDLVLLDELGTSTEPGEGAALAMAILEHFRALGAMTFVTTHHSRLKAYAAETPQAVNAAMEFDEATLEPTYRLRVGLPGKSSALDIAARLGLAASILEKARATLDPTQAEGASLIARLHAQTAEFEQRARELELRRQELEAQAADLQKQFERERRAKLRELDARLEETLRRIEEKWEKTLADLRARQGTAETAKKLARKSSSLISQAREEWNAEVLEALGAPPESEAVPSTAPLKPGDRVRISSLATPGTVTALLGEAELEVEVGRMRMRVPKKEVRVVRGASGSAAGPTAVLGDALAGEASEEINVIGATAEEARERVDKFLDQAYVAGRLRLRVVHGHGKGILRKSLHEMFASHPHVEKFYPAPPQEGGTGATIVELKQ